MTKKEAIIDFLAQKNFALYGASRNNKKFGTLVLVDLSEKGYNLYPVHPEAESIENHKCYKSLPEIPLAIDGAILCIPPSETEKVVHDIIAAGIKRVWMQQGSESNEAIRLCQDNGINVISKECIFMFAEPSQFFHKAHRWLWGVIGQLPK